LEKLINFIEEVVTCELRSEFWKSLKNFGQNTGEKFERFILIRILVKSLKDFDQNSEYLMKNLKNFAQNTGEKFERFRSEFWSDDYGILQ
jgi:hypothetical protein